MNPKFTSFGALHLAVLISYQSIILFMKENNRTVQILNMLVLMYILVVSGGSNGRCLEHEKQALLKFKEGLIDYGNLASWTIEEDCCRWRGVECDNRAGHIIRLDLHPEFSHADHDDFTWTPMDSVISSSLLDLRHLSHLDLSGTSLRKFQASLVHSTVLVYLNLSGNSISGTIPY